MKFLKHFNESVELTKNWISDVMNTCKDIMIELEDAGTETDVKRILSGANRNNSVLIECNININYKVIKSFRMLLIEIKERLIDYMQSEGFELVDYSPFPIDGKLKLSFKKSDIDNDYIGHLRYLRKYNLD